MVQDAFADQEEDTPSANKKGTKRRLRKKKRDKKGVNELDESFLKLDVSEAEVKATPVRPVPTMPLKLAIEVKRNEDDNLKLTASVTKETCAGSRTPDVKHVATTQLVKKAVSAAAKQPVSPTVVKSGSEPRNKPVSSDVFEDNRPPPDVLERLAKEYIHPLRKRHSKFPKAMFFCRLCEYHCDTVPICYRHLKESRHLKNKRIRELETTLRNLPAPTESHTEVLTELLLDLHQRLALTDDDLKVRQSFVKDLNVKIHDKLPTCEIRLYGSSLTGIGTKEADVNIDLVVNDKENPAKILMTVFDLLKDNDGLLDVKSDFGAKIPTIVFLEKRNNLKCVVSLNNLSSYKTTCLLAEYAKIDPRVRILGVVFRHWAKLCCIDRQMMGTLPSYSYILLLVYFLQQQGPPVLPVLHEMKKKPDEEHLSSEEASKQWETLNKQSVGTLWVELFKFYSVAYKMTDFVISLRQLKPVTRSEKNWSTKKIALEDPYSPKRNLARFISNQILFDYILERFKMTYKYFGIPQTTKGPLFTKLLGDEQDNEHHSDNKVAENSSGKSFLEALDNISKRTREVKLSRNKAGEDDDDDDDNVVVLSVSELKKQNEASVDSVGNGPAAKTLSKQATKNAKNGKNLATKQDIDGQLESNNRNDSGVRYNSRKGALKESALSEPLMLNAMQDDIDSEDLSETSPPGVDDDSEQENCIPASLMEALDDDLDGSSLSGAEGSDNPTPLTTNHDTIFNGDIIESLDDSHSRVKSGGKDNDSIVDGIVSPEKQGLATRDGGAGSSALPLKVMSSNAEVKSKAADSAKKVTDRSSSKDNQDQSPKAKRPKTPKIPEELLAEIRSLEKKDLCFQFKQADFTGGKLPSVFCSVCQKEGHLKQECPEEKLPELVPLPRMDRKFMKAIDQSCYEIYTDNCPRDYETAERLDILHDLQGFIRHHLYPDARLELFGSSCNGFGFAHSDMDICLTFANNATGEDLKCVPIIESLTEKLKKHRNLYNVIPITTAKVPIVKFTHRPSRLEGDISLYNTLAQHNTRMLLLYSELDSRVKILGYTMKFFAKCCDIGDASRGSLSSYAYILMVIYFLQQRQPPVIPVLQELYDKKKTAPTRIVDGWNAWFLDDAKMVQKRWPNFGKNQESVGELWLGLLRFYTEEFNFQDYVISIRQHKMLTRFEKLWNSKSIAIEDPFDLQHNLGAGVSRKMNSYIMKAFIKGRFLFGTPPRLIPYRYHTLKEYLFSPAELTDGAPPNDRGCRFCGKIGHMIKDCPRKRPHNRENAGRDQIKDQSRDNVQAQSSDSHRGQQTKEPNRDQNRDSQRPAREKKAESFSVDKKMTTLSSSQVYSLPNSLQFSNSLLPKQSSINILLPTPMINVPFNRNGLQPRPGLHNGQYAPNLPPTPPHAHQLTGMRLTSTTTATPLGIGQDDVTAQNRAKASNSMPNLALSCMMTPLLTQPTSKSNATPVDKGLSLSKGANNNSPVESSAPHTAKQPNSSARIPDMPPPTQYSRAITQVSSALNNNKNGAEQLKSSISAPEVTSSISASSAETMKKPKVIREPYDLLAEMMKDRPTMGAPTTVFTSEILKDSSATSNIHLPEKVRLMNAQNLRSSASSGITSPFTPLQLSSDNVPTSFGLQIPLGQHPPSFSVPPGFVNVNYRVPFPQRQFPADAAAPFNALHEAPMTLGRGRGRLPPPPPGIPVATSFSPVCTSAGESNTSGQPRQPNSASQFPSNVQSPLPPQPSQQFTQYPGIFHPYPAQYFPVGLPAYPMSTYGQIPSQQLQQQFVQTIPSGHSSPAPSPQQTLHEHGSHVPMTVRTAADSMPIPTSAQTRSSGTSESSPLSVPGNHFPSSHERPSENILLNAMGIVRPNASHDNQWTQLYVASNTHSQMASSASRSNVGGSLLHQDSPFTFHDNDSD